MERSVAHVALFAAMIAALGLVPPINFAFGIPVTAQSLGVMMAGAVLGSRRGFAAVGLFLLLVALGLPLLSGGRGGLGVFGSPTAGFALGYPIAAFVTGLFVEHVRMRTAGFTAGIGAVMGCIVVLYIFGASGLAITAEIPLIDAFKLTAIFIPGDLVKAMITGMLVQALVKVRPRTLNWYYAAEYIGDPRL